MRSFVSSWLSVLFLVLAIAGCGPKTPPTTATMESPASADAGWWCAEHGVPEGECARCDSSLVAGFKSKGDWCKEHDRPESQCFLCDPKRFEKFASRYEAKLGTKPPKPVE